MISSGRDLIVLFCFFLQFTASINGAPAFVKIFTCENGGTLVIDVDSTHCDCLLGYGGRYCERAKWIPPAGWTGPDSFNFWSFDTLVNVALMEGREQNDYDALVEGRVISAVSTNRSLNQWVFLGTHLEVCMTRMTCGAAGGAISMWMKLIDCPDEGGIISTLDIGAQTGFRIFCKWINAITYTITTAKGQFFQHIPHVRPNSTTWVHSVMNYLGPNDGQGTRVYHDGQSIANITRLHTQPTWLGDGEIALGKFHIAPNIDYASVVIDELLFFEQVLSLEEIRALSEYTTS